jgi:hypothetical protein
MPQEPSAPADLDAVRAIKQKYEAELLAVPKVVAVGIGLTAPRGPDKTRVPCIIISVSEADPAHDDIPSEIDGVPVLVNRTGVFKRR